MRLKDILYQIRPKVLEKWLDRIIMTYPADTVSFLKKDKDQFTNPIGHSLSSEIGMLYDSLLGDCGEDALAQSVDRIIRVRAVQDFSASEGVGFVFFVKGIVREELRSERLEEKFSKELEDFEARVDGLALKCFDIYMACCRRLYEIRVAESKKRIHMILRKANEASNIAF